MDWKKIVLDRYGQEGVDLVQEARRLYPHLEVSKSLTGIVLPEWSMGIVSLLAEVIEGVGQGQDGAGPPSVEGPVDIVDELVWNNNPRWPFPNAPRDLGNITVLTIHHSGATLREHTSILRWNDYHTLTKSWSHIGYHACIASYQKTPAKGGEFDLYLTNRLEQVTWHDTSNYTTCGIVFAGDLRSWRDKQPTPEQVDLWGRFVAWFLPQVPNLTHIVPHSFHQQTACPGDWEGWSGLLIESAKSYGYDIEGLIHGDENGEGVRTLRGDIPYTTPADQELIDSQRDV